MAVIIGWGMPVNPDEPVPDVTFDQIQSSIDRETWIGRACTEQLPGGGNDPKQDKR